MPPAQPSATDDTQDGQDHLGKLGEELTALGYQADLHVPHDRLPYLNVRNPRASVLAERVYAQADSYWFSWAERIADCDEVTTAATTLARLLRTVGE